LNKYSFRSSRTLKWSTPWYSSKPPGWCCLQTRR